jgi:hypothetical protein
MHKTKISSFINFLCHLKGANESQKDIRKVETRQLLCNATVRRLACPLSWELSFLVFHKLRSQSALLISVPCVQLSLIKFLGSCSCVVVASFVGMPSPLMLILIITKFNITNILICNNPNYKSDLIIKLLWIMPLSVMYTSILRTYYLVFCTLYHVFSFYIHALQCCHLKIYALIMR